jgi:cytochrome c
MKDDSMKVFASVFGVLALSLIAVGGAGQAQSAPPALDGAKLFKQKCALCHKSVAGQSGGLGPNLAGVAGRKAASTTYKYSPALMKSAIVWTKPELDRFLTAPAKAVPGTRMAVAVSDAGQRAAIINYLATLK